MGVSFLLLLGMCCWGTAWYGADGRRLFYRGRPMDRYGMLGNIGHRDLGLFAVNSPQPQWMQQILDHFNPADTRTWKQRYFVNDTFFRPGGPVFMQLGGEGEASPEWVVQGQHMAYAQKYGALVVELEHRFYGQSRPTKNTSVKNLRYLTSEQALADAANFQTYFSNLRGLHGNKWVAFGGSYSGALAAWYRMKYPHLVTAAVASSAPVYAVANFKEYLGVVRDSLATSSDSCVSVIGDAFKEISASLQNQSTWKTFESTFRLCDKLNRMTPSDVSNLFSTLTDNVNGVVQYNKDNRAFEGAKGVNITIDVVCNIMTNTSSGCAMQRFAEVSNMLLDVNQVKCLDYKYEKFVNQMRSSSWNDSASEGGRQWTYQTCIEFGYFQSSDLDDQPFGKMFPVEYFIRQCKDIFGPLFSEDLLKQGINATNRNYGGFGLEASRIVFPNGSIDPWHALGFTKDLSPSAPALFINGTAHCADMYPDGDADSPQLVAARERICSLIGQWLKE